MARMPKPLQLLWWGGVATLGALSVATIALHRGEQINTMWLVVAATCCYALGYRFYSKFVAAKVLALDAMRATPAERLENGRDFVRTNKWVVFGHHFAAIAGPGPLVGPVLAAQFGYLPGTLWILVGAVFGGCVQDFVILLFSVRRDGKSLTEMAKDEIGRVGGFVAYVAVISIIVILLGVCALIVVNALKASPWGTFTIAMTIPIALLMGVYLRGLRPGKVLESSILGFALVLLAIWGGQWVSQSPTIGRYFTLTAPTLAILIILYGFAASALPVWLLLAPRDYLSTFVKLGTIAMLALGIVALRPTLHMPALTRFIDGTGPVFAGNVFPFAFITIACGAISGFHSLISSGTTPKLLTNEVDARPVGYGAMLTESLVAVMALIAACVLTPGVYFAINAPASAIGTTAASAAAAVQHWGFVLDPAQMQVLAQEVGEKSLLSRTGGAPSLAVGMAHIFSRVLGGSTAMALWYHFAIMFEALFILTTVDAGTRVGRFMLQDLLKHVWAPIGRVSWYPAVVMASGLVVAMWGYFLYQGVMDPLGGINSLWPLFGISNQLLAAVALCVGTTVIIKMGKARYAWVTILPLTWLAIVTMTAGVEKIFSTDPRLGFLSHARMVGEGLAIGILPPGVQTLADARRLILNDRIDTAVAAFFLISVIVILVASIHEWFTILSGRKIAHSTEVAFEAANRAA